MCDLLNKEDKIIYLSDLSKYNGEIACFREIHDEIDSPIEKLLEESNISFTYENLE